MGRFAAVFAPLAVCLIAAQTVAFADHIDGMTLMVALGAAPGSVSLDWTGGQPTFKVYRSTSKSLVVDPANLIGTTDVRTFADTPPAGSAFFYEIWSPCVYNPPEEVCNGLDGCSVNVATAAALTTALQNAQPDQMICLAAGTYTGRFVATVSGTTGSHIVLAGPATAVLDGGDNTTGYGFHLSGASYWELRGFTVRNSKKGIMTDSASNNLIDGVTVRDIGEEGIHLRTFSSNNTIQNSTVTNTGLVTPGYGEGVYIGSANSNWCTYTNCQPDMSDNNWALNNHIGPNVRAEGLDIKEGTTGGTVSGNYLDATGISGANFAQSWIDVKGNNYTISGNTGVNPTHTTVLKDGFRVHVAVSGWGNNTTFATNNLDVESTGYGFWVQSGVTGTVVCTNNVVTTAASGTANVPLTACQSRRTAPHLGYVAIRRVTR